MGHIFSDSIRTIMNKFALAADGSVQGILPARFAWGFVKMFKKSDADVYSAWKYINSQKRYNNSELDGEHYICKVLVHSGWIYPDGEGSRIREWIYQKLLIICQKTSTNSCSQQFWKTWTREQQIELIPVSGEGLYELCVAKKLLLLELLLQKPVKIRNTTLSSTWRWHKQCIWLKRRLGAIFTVKHCVCRMSQPGIDHRCFIKGISKSEESFEMDVLQTLQGYVNVIRANHVIMPFTERVPWPFWRFYLNKFHCFCFFAWWNELWREYTFSIQ